MFFNNQANLLKKKKQEGYDGPEVAHVSFPDYEV